jgi:hypothetical protein
MQPVTSVVWIICMERETSTAPSGNRRSSVIPLKDPTGCVKISVNIFHSEAEWIGIYVFAFWEQDDVSSPLSGETTPLVQNLDLYLSYVRSQTFVEQRNLSFWDNYEGEAGRMSQMDIKRKSCDNRTWQKKSLFLDISFTNIDTLVPSLYQCVEVRKYRIILTVFSATSAPLFQPLHH